MNLIVCIHTSKNVRQISGDKQEVLPRIFQIAGRRMPWHYIPLQILFTKSHAFMNASTRGRTQRQLTARSVGQQPKRLWGSVSKIFCPSIPKNLDYGYSVDPQNQLPSACSRKNSADIARLWSSQLVRPSCSTRSTICSAGTVTRVGL
uniref:Uncharacterized protein n=1 Tax=Schistocephalus solidus TaxID=70667 RepID=A0A0X3PRC6_SCHSO